MLCRNILIVEDDLSIRQSMRDVLEISGYTVYTAANGAEGLEMLELLAGASCVILIDMTMPKMNGWQFLDVQRTDPRYKNIPVVICAAYEEI
jgi:CheY-like chemotaxis protein